MKLYELEPNTAIVVHPNDPDVKVELLQPELMTIFEFQEKSSEVKTQVERFKRVLEYLAKHVKRAEGLMDRTGKPIILKAPIEAEALTPFVRPSFDCEYEAEVDVLDKDGKPTGAKETKKVKDWFANYLITRLLKEDTFVRPLEAGSIPSTSPLTSG